MCPGHIVLPGASRESRSQKSAVRSQDVLFRHHFEIQYSLFDNLRFAFVGLPGFKIQVTLKHCHMRYRKPRLIRVARSISGKYFSSIRPIRATSRDLLTVRMWLLRIHRKFPTSIRSLYRQLQPP